MKKTLVRWGEKLRMLVLTNIAKHNSIIEIIRDLATHIHPDALSIIEGALSVLETHARDIMVPRVNMITISHKLTFDQILNIVTTSGHSRFPVIGDNADEVLGILIAKDLLSHVDGNDKFNIKDSMRLPTFIPESKRLNTLLSEFKESRNHMAIVVDEYANVAGLVTIEDVVEEIIGEIKDEHDSVDDDGNITAHSKGRYLVNGLTPIDEFNSYFGVTIDKSDYETIGGVVSQLFGHLPSRGEQLEHDVFHIKVLRSDQHRISLLRIEKILTAAAINDTD